ncbi:peptide chain release factor N(5)-glutamine methyltransferase [Candidatus Sumerlaeota bacterium]|nr:peptide chain release factor N(5)-glutamine methyltransferase [Candidatus Sumerlaeota bacterium]
MTADETLTIKDAIDRSARWLEEKGIDPARLDAELLLGHLLGLERLDLYLQWDRRLDENVKTRYRDLLKRRAAHEPVAYIVGTKEFYSLPLKVTRDVLIPRPETELLVERALELIADLSDTLEEGASIRVADVGTGSGAVALALASQIPDLRIVATDVSRPALDIARENAAVLGFDSEIEFVEGAFLEAVQEPVHFVVSNPPYVAERDRESLPPDVAMYEPHGALFAGEDGLDAIRALAPQAAEALLAGGWLAMEIGHDQASEVRAILSGEGRFEEPVFTQDFRGIDRVVAARRK